MQKENIIAVLGILIGLGAAIAAMALPQAHPNLPLLGWRFLFWGGFAIAGLSILFFIYYTIATKKWVGLIIILFLLLIAGWGFFEFSQKPPSSHNEPTKDLLQKSSSDLQGIRQILENEVNEARKYREGNKTKEAQQLKEQEDAREAQKRREQDEQKKKEQEEAKAEYERRLWKSEQQAKLEELRKKLQAAEKNVEQMKIGNEKNSQIRNVPRKTNLNITQEEPNNQAEIEELKRKIKEAEARARAAAEKADKILKGQGQISPRKPYLEPRAAQPEEKIGAIPPPPRRPLYNRVDPDDEKWNKVKMKYFEEGRQQRRQQMEADSKKALDDAKMKLKQLEDQGASQFELDAARIVFNVHRLAHQELMDREKDANTR